MSIRDKRYAKALNKILREELQKGNLPTSREFISKLNEYTSKNNLHGPALNFKNIREHSLARDTDYNKTMDDTYGDLETLYESIIEQHDTSIKHFNKFEVEKNKLDYELNALETKLKELILLYGQEGYLNSVYDIFVDFSHINTEKTDANVDISKHEVRISDIKNRSKKISPEAVTSFELLPTIKAVTKLQSVSGTTADALNDKATSSWQVLALTDEKLDVSGYYTVSFKEKQSMNRISLNLQTVKPVYIRIEITSDNINWTPLPYYEEGLYVNSQYTFDFPTIEITQLRIMMAKPEADSETVLNQGSGAMKYSYLFGIQNLSFFTFQYSLEASLYSNVHDVEPDAKKNFTIDKVSLHVDEELPSGTDIKYYIAIPTDTDMTNLEWKSISPVNRDTPQFDQMIDFKNIATSVPTVFSINPKISIGEYEMESLYANGIKFYKVGEIENRKIISGTERLFMGRNTWGVKSFAYQQPDHATHIPTINDWSKPQGVVTDSFTKIEDGKPGLLLNKKTSTAATNYMFTLGVFSTKAKELVVATPTSFDPITIYLNGQVLYQGIPDASTKVSYLFENGWNEIIVLSYNSKSINTVNGATLDINFDPRKYGSNVYAKAKPLTLVSLFDLRYNTLNNDYGKYAIQQVNNKSQVILNNAMPGLEYDFYYNYIDGTVKDQILLKAVLQRDESVTETSPKLKSYRLRFS